MATTKPRGRKPLPTPTGQTTEIPIYGSRSWNYNGLQELPGPFEHRWATGFVPDEIRRQMLMHPKVSQATENLKSAILGTGGRVIPAVSPLHPEFELAKELCDMCRHALRQMRGSWHVIARQLLDAVHECHKVAAITLREGEAGTYTGYWLLDGLQILPNATFRFLRAPSGDVPKLRVRVAGAPDGRRDIDRDHFAVLTFRPVDGSIFGTTVYAATYEPYYKDVQLDPLEMSNAAQFGTPTMVVIAPGRDNNGLYPPDLPVFQADGKPLLDEFNEQVRIPVTESIARALEEVEAGSTVVLPGDSEFLLVEPKNGGELMTRMRESNERRIASAIMGTDQLTESRNQMSGDNKGIAQDVAGLGVTDGKRALEEMVENDLFRDIVRYNYGDAALDYLPFFDLGSGQNARLVSMLNAIAAYISNGALDEAQWWSYCRDVGLEMPDPTAPKVVPASATRGSGGAHGNVDNSGGSNSNA